MSARFGLRIRRRWKKSGHPQHGSKAFKAFLAGIRELAAALQSPGSQAVIAERRRSRVKPEAPKPRQRRRKLATQKSFNPTERLKKRIAAIEKSTPKWFAGRRRAHSAKRALACLEAGVRNTGRQWRKLRKQRKRARA